MKYTNGQKLLKIRGYTGLLRKDFAALLGVTPSTTRNYDRDLTPITVDVLQKLMDIGVNPEIFFVEDPFSDENIKEIKAAGNNYYSKTLTKGVANEKGNE